MATYTMRGRNEFPSTDPARLGKTDVAYMYMDENLHTIMIQVPLEKDNREYIEAELKKRVAAAASAGPAQITI